MEAVKRTRGSAPLKVDIGLCDERNKNIAARLQVIDQHLTTVQDGVQELSVCSGTQNEINKQVLEQLKDLAARTRVLEEKPAKRWEASVMTVLQFATLLLLGLLVSKIGL